MFSLNGRGQLIFTPALERLLAKIQSDGNRVTYQTDKQTYGVDEKWAFPKQVSATKLVGDCEDIALYKRKILVDAGVPSSALLMTICLDPDGGGHCVLCAVTTDHDIVLCNNHDGLTSPAEMRGEGYRFLYRQQLGHGINEPWDKLL